MKKAVEILLQFKKKPLESDQQSQKSQRKATRIFRKEKTARTWSFLQGLSPGCKQTCYRRLASLCP